MEPLRGRGVHPNSRGEHHRMSSGGSGDPAGAAPEAASAAGGSKNKVWLPVESNPDLMNAFACKAGLPAGTLHFVDLLSTDDWALDMVPRPVKAVLMLYPIKEASEEFNAAEAARIATSGQFVDPSVYFCTQYVGNACGTIAILHAVANASDLTGGDLALTPGTYFEKFIRSTLGMSADDRGRALEADDSGADASLGDMHAEIAEQGQSEVCDDTNNHFVAFVPKNGHLYELDGRKGTPINHGAVDASEVLEKCVLAVKEFMARDPEELRFTMVALTAGRDEE